FGIEQPEQLSLLAADDVRGGRLSRRLLQSGNDMQLADVQSDCCQLLPHSTEICWQIDVSRLGDALGRTDHSAGQDRQGAMCGKPGSDGHLSDPGEVAPVVFRLGVHSHDPVRAVSLPEDRSLIADEESTQRTRPPVEADQLRRLWCCQFNHKCHYEDVVHHAPSLSLYVGSVTYWCDDRRHSTRRTGNHPAGHTDTGEGPTDHQCHRSWIDDSQSRRRVDWHRSLKCASNDPASRAYGI